jgi:hypothetical protein
MTPAEQQRMIDDVVARLVARFPDLSQDVVRTSVDASLETTRNARVTDFLAILVERDAADSLRHREELAPA